MHAQVCQRRKQILQKQILLVDTAHKKVYQLSDQEKPKEFAGQKVKVTGTLSGETIQVSTIEGAQ